MPGVAERDRGEWIPWYCETTPGWAELSFAARGVAEGIARLMGRSRGEIHLGSRGLRGLCLLLHGRWEEFEPAMCELLSPGPNGEPPRLVLTEDHRMLIDPEHDSRRRPTSAERVAKHRAKKPDHPPAPPPGDVTPVTVTPVTSPPVTRAGVTSPLLSSDLKISEADQNNLPGGSRGAPPPETAPPWFADLVQAICDDTGERFAVPEAWMRYSGHRATKGIAVNVQDARYWLGTVMVPEARKERRAESDRRLNQHRRDGPPERPRQSREDARREAQAFAAHLAARRKESA